MAAVLEANVRAEKGKYQVDALRESGLVPGIVYGNKKDSQTIAFSRKDIERILLKGDKDVDLNVAGNVLQAKIVEVQYFPTGSFPIHVDFQYR